MIGAALVVLLGLAEPAAVPVLEATPPAEDARAAFERGRRLYEGGEDMKGARAALDEAIALRPDYADAYLYRALVTMESHSLSVARPDFEFALKLSPDNKEAHRHYADALAAAGEVDAAEAHYQQALALDPDYADAIFQLAVLYRGKRMYKEAIALLERHALLEPKMSAHHQLGEIYLEQGQDDRAMAEFEKDLAVDESCYESRQNLAGLYLDRKDYQAAREQYETSLMYHPADARALSGLGRTYLAVGDFELAVGTLRQAQDLSPDDREVAAALDSARGKLKAQYGGAGGPQRGWVALAALLGLAAGLAVYLIDRAKRKARA